LTPEIAESLPTPTPTAALAPTPTPAPTPTAPVLAPKPIAVPPVESPEEQASPEEHASPEEPPPSSRLPRAGSGVRAPSRSSQLMRLVRSSDGKGLGPGAIVLILLVAALAGAAVVVRLTRRAPSESHEVPAPAAPHAAGVQDAAPPVPAEVAGPTAGSSETSRPNPPAAGAGSDSRGSSRSGAGSESGAGNEGGAGSDSRGSSGSDTQANSAGTPGRDAGVSAASGGSAANPAGASGGSDKVDKIAEAKALFDKAHAALDESDFQRAFELAEASLKLRRTARTYLLRAQAQQRLDRVIEALASVDAAAQIAPDYSGVWEMRGRILWASGRHDEARAAFERFLALEPNGAKAAEIQRLMNEPR
jgi:tetratricopeptide repeat protein